MHWVTPRRRTAIADLRARRKEISVSVCDGDLDGAITQPIELYAHYHAYQFYPVAGACTGDDRGRWVAAGCGQNSLSFKLAQGSPYRCDRNCNKFCFRPIARPAGKFSTY
ncbi:hypothetical protein BOTBODRAFT_300408 [Botryobasidium botryosum FD-172 SS1]|uniref:Uncharacterized protein n=1 Tax=Botryobasidium botryosum (strain FD-172 SS1) TaxID=930990 RepID=A0A067MT16_BOTB1|nr:hypothetical protein BOTBODRAFT_300408 [Botryobasidium botryosum FD-172 SS1]